ncbi:hypothetical protein A2625_06710 [candidate division WOR-1 bacterium RIFCSPHIGHO2_01_FULL_53_15]|uniref:Uncharacterized protein n=1 Tax=candidate division WOR-1 bacterium RIFCSPHIGHO2_01_FULL_53_15 TaxID=1802564 RepID=A0A1F4Q500_UNCSA|nr:MAG: hypothetical protein A2625_06710 [candidate division WOR-1 bacterium RIFCSPHIGHO2_01_FULL_53_15]OGC10295.1 MAG: hypothetical protein A3D23_06715 [candidate division WOR-1 bacterium RIFCSPHIGHO2_02_FULL_53_26]
MGIIAKYISKYAAAGQQWQRWRSLVTRQRALVEEGKARKSEKVERRVLLARRDFLSAAWGLAKAPLVAAALGGAAAPIGNYLYGRYVISDPLAKAYRQYGGGFPFPLEYLEGLKISGGAADKELEDVAANHSGPDALYPLFAYCLLKRAIGRKEMSARYSGFLSTVSDLISQGRIKFKTHEFIFGDDVFYYDYEADTININPQGILIKEKLGLVESSFIHELYHAYQDRQKRLVDSSEIEAEAHLAQTDFILHTTPGLIHPAHWLHLFPLKNGAFERRFLVPAKLAAPSVNLPETDPKLRELIMSIRRIYNISTLLVSAADNETTLLLERKIALETPPTHRERFLKDLLSRAFEDLSKKRPAELFVCAFGQGEKMIIGPEGIIGKCEPDKDVRFFAVATRLLTQHYAGARQLDRAQAVLNEYLINKIIGTGLLPPVGDSSFGPGVQLDGIK